MRCLIFVLCVALLISLTPSLAQDESAPYLFYYSSWHNAFVIERADGTDSRLFAEDMMPPETNAIYGPGWSPSGEWFAWMSQTIRIEEPDSDYHTFALSVDGTRRVTALDAYPHATLKWAPDADLLLVQGHDPLPEPDPIPADYMMNFYAAVIDPAADRVSGAYSWQIPYANHNAVIWPSSPYFWSNTTQPFLFFDADEIDPQAVLPENIMLYSDDQRSIMIQPPISPQLDQLVVRRGPDNNHITAYDGDSLFIENLITGERELFEGVPDELCPTKWLCSIEWRSDQRYALLENTEQLWLLNRENKQLNRVHAQIQSQDLLYPFESYWSPSGNYTVFLAEDYRFYVFNLAQNTLNPLTPPLQDPRYELDILMGGWHWYGDDQVLLTGVPTENDLQVFYLCDLATTICDSQQMPAIQYGQTPQVSANAQYAAYVLDEVIVADLMDASFFRLSPDSRGYWTVAEGAILWHPTSDWFIIQDNATIAGGGSGYWTSVAHASGSVRRELGHTWSYSLGIGWLPPQVDPTTLAPGTDSYRIPDPVTVLHGDQWAWYLSWSPDSTHLLTGRDPNHDSIVQDMGSTGKSTLWEITSGQPAGTFSSIGWFNDVHWIPTDDLGYNLQIITLDEIWGAEVLATSPDGAQRVIWKAVEDVATGDTLIEFDGYLDCMGYGVMVSYSPDGRWLATPLHSPAGSRIAIWDTITWEEIGTIPGTFQAAAFSPDGRWLAASHSWDIQIWDVAELLEFGAR